MKPRHSIRNSILSTGLALFPFTASYAQTTGTWNTTATTGLSWNTAASWTGLTGGLVPNAIGATPNFTFNITAAKTITLDGDKIVGTLTIDDPGTSGFFGYTLNAGTTITTSQLTFDVTSGNAGLNSANAANTASSTIGAGITLNDPLVINWAKTNVNGAINLNGVITDGAASLGITKDGNGIALLGNANTYDGGTIINGGRLGAGNAAAFGTGSVTVNSGGQAYMSTAATFGNNFNIAGDGYSNTADASALVGAIRYQSSFTTGTITLNSNARIGGTSGTTGTIAGPITGGPRDLEINSTANATHNGNIVLTGDASGLKGMVTVSQGTLRLGTASNLGGSLTVGDGANLYADNIGTPGGATLAGNLTLGKSGSTTTGANFYVDPSSDDALQVSGNLTLNGSNTVILTGPLASNPVIVMKYAGALTGSDLNLTLQGGLSAYRPGTGFTTTGNQIKLNVVLGDVKWTGAANNNWNTTDTNWTDAGTPTTFYALDAVTFDDSASPTAKYTTNLANATNNDLVFTAVASGAAGEAVQIAYVDPYTPPSSPLSVSVTGSTINVSLGTDASGLIISTANDIKTAIEANPLAITLATVALAASNDGSGLVAILNTSALAMPNPTITIASGVTVSPGDMTFDHSAIDYTISGSGAIAGGGSLTKTGSGMLTLATANSFAGGSTLTNGRLRVGLTTALGTAPITITGGQLSSSNTSTRTMSNGAVMSGSFILGDATDDGGITLNGASTLAANTTIDVPSTSTHTLGGAITDGTSSFSLTKKGTTGILALSGANTYDGGTLIEEGRINASNAASFGTGTVTVSDGAQAYLAAAGTFANAFTVKGNGFTDTSGTTGAIRLAGATVSGPITLTGDTRITAHGSTGTLSGNIGESGGQYALELANYSTSTDSTITVSGNNSHSFGTTVKGAVVIANHNNAFGTGPVTIQSNGTVARVTRVQLGTNIELPAANSFVLDSDASSGTSAITSYAGDNTTPSTAIVNGPVEILKKVGGGGGHFASTKGSASVLRVMGAVTSPNDVPVVLREGTVELGGGGTYGAIEITDGLLKLANSNGLCSTSTLSIGTSSTSGHTGTFDLNGHSQTLAGLAKGAQPATVTNNGASPSTLTLNPAGATTYAGVFANGASTLNLLKTGAGTLTLSGDSSTGFTGDLSVTGGGLNLTGKLGTTGATASIVGTTLSGEGTFGGSLTLSSATVNVNGSTPLGVFASGNLNSTGGVTVSLQSLPAAPGPIEVIAFGGILTGSAGDFTLAGASNYRSPVFSVAANAVNLTLGTPVDLTWTGTGGSDWDIGTTSNWNNPSANPSTFLYADNVSFGNTGGGTVGVPASVGASNLVINSNDNWLFQGSGTVTAASVTKDGSGSATFETKVDFSGPIALTAGVLKLSLPAGVTATVAGAISGAGTLAKGGDGILSLSSANPGFSGPVVISKGELAVSNSTALGTGTLTFGDASTLPADVAKLTLNSGTTVSGKTITVAPECLSAAVSSLGGTLDTATILKRGPGTLRIGDGINQLATTNYLTGTSTITVEGGVIGFSSITATTASTTIVLGTTNSGSTDTILDVPVAASADQVTLSTPVTLGALAGGSTSKAILRYSGSSASLGSSNFSGTVALNGRDLYIENTSESTPGSIPRLWAAAGVISGTGNVRIRCGIDLNGNYTSTGRARLGGTNVFTGDLYLDSGMVQLGKGAAGSTLNTIPNASVAYVSAGTRLGVGGGSETFAGIVGGAASGTAAAAILNPNTGGSGTTTVTLSGAGTYVYDGTISDESGHIFALVKSTGGTQTVNGACSYTGTTSITGGKLILNSTHTSPITVGAAGTLGGTMTSSEAITATAVGAKIAPGNSTGTMTAASANLTTGGVLEIEIDDSSTPKNDKLSVTGILNVTGATLNTTVSGTAAESAYVIASYGTLTGTFGTVNAPGFTVDYNYNDGVSSNNIALVKVRDPYLGWLVGYPTMTGANRAPDVDFDNDGLDNGVEFVIGSNPTTATGSDTPGYPAATVTSGNLVFTFKRSTASKAYPVTVETSLDLANWPPANAYLVPVTDSVGPPVAVAGETVTVTIPMAPDASKFARIKADIPYTP